MNLTARDSLPPHPTRAALLIPSLALDTLGGPVFGTFCPQLPFLHFLCALRRYGFEDFPAIELGAIVTKVPAVVTSRPRDAIHSDELPKAELLLVNATTNAPSSMAEISAKPTTSQLMLINELRHGKHTRAHVAGKMI